MSKIKIILAMPRHLGLIDIIAENLRFHGFDVICFDEKISPVPFKYPHLGYRLYKAYRKIFLKDNEYRNKIRNPINLEFIEHTLTVWQGYADYTLVIRPDMFSHEVLALLKSRTKHQFVGYQWDGLSRFPSVLTRIALFQRFFVFDAHDLQNYPHLTLLPTTNFCIDAYPHSAKQINQDRPLQAYFVGYHHVSRQEVLSAVLTALQQHKIHVNCFINHAPRHLYTQLPVQKIDKTMNFNDNLSNVQNSDILIDVVINMHVGLSFRIFEALFYQKKIITNNVSIKNYDFYHPDNILIWSEQNDEQLQEFLARPYNNTTDSVVKKYFFANWIRYMLDMQPYTAIQLPKVEACS